MAEVLSAVLSRGQDFDLAEEIQELNLQVRLWASQRSQTLGRSDVLAALKAIRHLNVPSNFGPLRTVHRTVAGAIQYHKVLETLLGILVLDSSSCSSSVDSTRLC